MNNKLLSKLQKLADGREVEIHLNPGCQVPEYRASVYVRGDRRDGFVTTVASGIAPTVDDSLRIAIRKMDKRGMRDSPRTV